MKNNRKRLIQKYAFGGEEEDPTNPKAKLTVKNRQDWNDYVDYLDKQHLKGDASLDKNNYGNDVLKKYIKANPNTSLTPDLIKPIQSDFVNYRQYAIDQIKTGHGEFAKGTNEKNFMTNLSKPDSWAGSETTQHQFPKEYLNYLDMQGNLEKTEDKGFSTTKMALGGNTMMDLANSAPDILNALMSLTNNTSYSRQPIVNASTMRNMSNPYSSMAMGGSIDDLDEGEMVQLQQLADENGVTPEEMYQQLGQFQEEEGEGQDDNEDQYQDQEDNDENAPEFGTGGWIKKAINPAHKGWCTPLSNPHCTGHRRALALLFKRKHGFHKHAMGGNTDINVEGGEVMQKPGGEAMRISGPKHESGGVDKTVPNGTKIYSDRLAINGVDMKDRKLRREARIKKIENLLKKNPTSRLVKNTVQRTTKLINQEDRQDMALQNAANKIYTPPQEQQEQEPEEGYAYGGKAMNYAMGGYGDDDYDTLPLMASSTGYINPNMPMPAYTGPNYNSTSKRLAPNGVDKYGNPIPNSNPGDFTTGDYVGLAGTAFGAIAPLVNTIENKRHTPLVVNRYTGVGQEALQTNENAQGYVGGQRTNAYTDLDTEANSSFKRNANGANSINTLRALNTVTNMGVNKSRNAVNDSFSKQMIGLLGNREQLENTRDQYQAYGQTRADDANAANTDNFYSNMGRDLSGIGTNIETTGRNFNVSHSNKVNANLISQLSQYGLEFDENGNLVNKVGR